MENCYRGIIYASFRRSRLVDASSVKFLPEFYKHYIIHCHRFIISAMSCKSSKITADQYFLKESCPLEINYIENCPFVPASILSEKTMWIKFFILHWTFDVVPKCNEVILWGYTRYRKWRIYIKISFNVK